MCGVRTRKFEVTLDFPKRRHDTPIGTKIPEKIHNGL
jgi:hypothetical protein